MRRVTFLKSDFEIVSIIEHLMYRILYICTLFANIRHMKNMFYHLPGILWIALRLINIKLERFISLRAKTFIV